MNRRQFIGGVADNMPDDDTLTLLDEEPHIGWNLATDNDGKLHMVWIEEPLTSSPPIANNPSA